MITEIRLITTASLKVSPVVSATLVMSRGPQGVPGIQGLRGIQGDQGVQGIQGEQGVPGITGDGAGVTAHGLLTGLTLDQHPQYHTDARGDARYVGLLDPRLADARTPTEHNHVIADLTDFPEIPSIAGMVQDTDPRLSDARAPTAHQHPATDITDLPESSLSALTDVDLTGAAQGQALLFNGVIWTPGSIATGIERRFEAVSPYTYLGTAPLNSLDTAEVWTITRLDFTSGMVSAAATDVAWTDRLTATYI